MASAIPLVGGTRTLPLKMARGRKNLWTRGHRTRWARIRAPTCAHGHGHGYKFVPNGQRKMGEKIAYLSVF
jgi:hypothetical protein